MTPRTVLTWLVYHLGRVSPPELPACCCEHCQQPANLIIHESELEELAA